MSRACAVGWIAFWGVALGLPAPGHAAARPRIDVAFVLDATGSMGPWIDAARRRISDIAEELAAGDPKPEVRFALVAYRDKGDEFVTRITRFTPHLQEMKDALDGTNAAGGGDTPEAVLEALEAGVHGLDWNDSDPSTIKLLYLVGDAPPHIHPDSPDEETLLGQALERGIVIHTIACGDMDSGGRRFFERVARLSEGRPYALRDGVPHGGPAASGRGREAAGATTASSLGAVVSDSARAYSGAIGVTYAPRPRAEVSVTPMYAPPVLRSGLLGPHLRWVADATTWRDVWAAHRSLDPGGPVAAPPVDFEHQSVLVLGGADAGLELDRVESDRGVRFAIVRPSRSPGVRFVLIDAGDPVVAAATAGGTR
ncbi:MAG: VWA domain-containing protein [Deltaproteobacteria bacterium]|nr:VWA domain-containing protein [Deltaproteobacteria bacterium]MCB9785750.1 VWA domain-containing protein [Deltaproteobacteria bacterium]